MKEHRKANRRTRRRSRNGVAGIDKSVASPSANRRSLDLGAILVPGAGTTGHNLQYSASHSAIANAAALEELYGALGRVTEADHPRTFKLLRTGRHRLTRKLIEEACEVAVEVLKREADGVVRESADLLYQLVVLWFRSGIEPNEIWREMQTRASTLGIAEKLPKKADRNAAFSDGDR